jgi:ERCC4-related helicase
MPKEFLKNIEPRDYQKEIFESCKDKNCLIILPTGVGKTLVALMLVIDRMKKFPLNKILFLAPTRPLAEQHLSYFKKHLPEMFAEMNLFTGKIQAPQRKKIWQRSDIIFSTPQCIGNDLKKRLYSLDEVSLLIEDEVHRCVKNYSYTFVAKKYLEQSKTTQIIGMTASPGTDKKTINAICEKLEIEKIEMRNRESKDVKEFLQELNFKIIKLEFPKKFQEINELIKKIYQRNIRILQENNLINGPANKITILEAQRKISLSIKQNPSDYSLYAGASAAASALKISHAIELLETQTLYSLDSYLNNLKQDAAKNQSKAVKKIVASPEFTQAKTIIQDLISQEKEHPKLLELKDLINEKVKANPKYKTIVFTQYRDTVQKICDELKKINITAKPFVGQTKKGESGLSQKEQKKIIEEFSRNEFSVLCATSIGEEGLDIPEVNAVIFYEPIPSAIRTIQRRGRTARLMPGELIMLITKNTRDEIYYWSSFQKEKRMNNAVSSITEDLNSGKINFNNNQKQLF